VMERTGPGLRLAELPTAGPAAKAGLQQGDQLVSVGGSLVNRSNWQSVLERFRPGDRVKVQVDRFGRVVDVEFVLGAASEYVYRLEDLPGVSDEARRLRAGWLSGK